MPILHAALSRMRIQDFPKYNNVQASSAHGHNCQSSPLHNALSPTIMEPSATASPKLPLHLPIPTAPQSSSLTSGIECDSPIPPTPCGLCQRRQPIKSCSFTVLPTKKLDGIVVILWDASQSFWTAEHIARLPTDGPLPTHQPVKVSHLRHATWRNSTGRAT